MTRPTGVLLVGSVPFSSAEEVFIKSVQSLAGRLQSIPDGETGIRENFTLWQSFVFPSQVLGPIHRKGKPLDTTDFCCTLDHIKPTKYDEAAIESYQTFRKLKDKGIIPQGVRFQVSVPTAMSTICTHVDYAYRGQVEPLYLERLIQDIKHLQAAIPAQDLAIQIDAAVEFAYLEYEKGRLQNAFFKPYADSVKEKALMGIAQLSSAVEQDVQLGFHLCYGDREHQHFVQPEDAGHLVEIATAIAQRVSPHHSISWVHLPVPKDRSDKAYFEPMKHLDIGDAKLFLGLVHAHDEDGTNQRLKAAEAIYTRPFGVATECGMGRTAPEDVESIFTIAKNVTASDNVA